MRQKDLFKILLLSILIIFSINLIVQCNYSALVKVECHINECENESDSNSGDCEHCIILKNVVIHTTYVLTEFPSNVMTYFLPESKYTFNSTHPIYHPPKV